jgi:hypothetical protein
LCKRLRKEKVTLEGMVESRDELIMEIAKNTRLDHMGEDVEDEEEDEDAGDGGDAAAPLLMRRLMLSHLRRSSWRKTL